jgi:transposase
MQLAASNAKPTDRSATDMEARLASLQSGMDTLKAENDALKQQLAWFKRQLFGRKSEKRLIDNPDQLGLADVLGEAVTTEPGPATQAVSYTRRKGKQRDAACVTGTGLRFTEQVPIEVIELSAPQLLGPDADQYEIIDTKVTRRLAQRPGSYVVLEYRRPVIRHKAAATLMEVPAPSAVLDNSLADVSLLAGLLVDKFCYHLPLYRQHQRLADAGITLSRTTLTQYTQRAIELLRPVYDAQWRHILQSKVLAMDETPIKAGKAGKGKLKTSWYWPVYGEDDEICFTWSPSRGSAHVKQQLGEFAGTLLSDGYAAYDTYAKARGQVTQAQCWAHTRRYFERAQGSDPAAAQALELIGALYTVERQIGDAGLEGAAKLDYRTRHAHPVVEAFFGWCHQQRQRLDLVNSAPLAKALVYADNHQAQLRVYLGDPDVPIDTNHLERALRVIPMGRKNWLFSWTEVGARHVGIIQSLLTACRLHGVDPYTYLVDVLQRISLHPARDVEQLTPRRWKDVFAAKPLRSDLQHAD